MATMNVSLPDQMKAWVEEQARGGRYGNASDYVRDLIRRDQEREAAIAELQEAVNEGVKGEPKPFDFDAFLDRKNREFSARGADAKAG